MFFQKVYDYDDVNEVKIMNDINYLELIKPLRVI